MADLIIPTMKIDEIARMAAERALNEYQYAEKTLREWVRLIMTAQDETGFDIEAVLMRLRSKDDMCKYCVKYPNGECEAKCDEECATWCNAQNAAELIECLYADNCARRAEMGLLTKDRDEWKRRAEAAEQALNDLKGNVVSVEACDKYYSCGSDNTYEYQNVAQWAIIREIMKRIEERNAVRYTTRRLDEYTVEMHGTISVLLEPLCDQEEKEAEP